MASTRNVFRGNRTASGTRCCLFNIIHIELSCSLREAIECLKRALIVADPRDTTINLRLAKLHDDLGELVEAAAYHRRVVEVCMAESQSSVYVPHPLRLTISLHSRATGPGLCKVQHIRRSAQHEDS